VLVLIVESSPFAGIIQADGNLPSQPLLAPGAAASQQSTVRMRCIRISPDSRQLCVGDQHGNLRLYDTETLKLLQLLEAHDDEVLCLDYSSVGSDGSFLAASGSRDTLIHIYDAQRGFELLETLDDHTAAVTALKFVSQGLISVGGDRSIIFR
jgi:WD40 repeat protein